MGQQEGRRRAIGGDANHIEVQLSQPYYIVGEHIKGKVIVSLANEFAMRRLEIRLTGKEHMSVYGNEKIWKIYDFTLVLDEALEDKKLGSLMPKILKPGKHEYPFAFSIQSHEVIPPTNSYHTSAIDFRVKYNMTVYATSFVSPAQNIKMLKPVEVLQKLDSEKWKKVSWDEVVCSGLRRFGRAKMVTTVDHTGFVVPAGIELTLDYNNRECRKAVKKFVITLTQNVTAFFNDTAKPIRETSTISQWELPGVPARSCLICVKRLIIQNPAILESLESCTGHFFSKSYVLSVVPEYDTCCCCAKPVARFDLKLTKRIRGREKNARVRREEVSEEQKLELNASADPGLIRSVNQPLLPAEKLSDKNVVHPDN